MNDQLVPLASTNNQLVPLTSTNDQFIALVVLLALTKLTAGAGLPPSDNDQFMAWINDKLVPLAPANDQFMASINDQLVPLASANDQLVPLAPTNDQLVPLALTKPAAGAGPLPPSHNDQFMALVPLVVPLLVPLASMND